MGNMYQKYPIESYQEKMPSLEEEGKIERKGEEKIIVNNISMQ